MGGFYMPLPLPKSEDLLVFDSHPLPVCQPANAVFVV